VIKARIAGVTDVDKIFRRNIERINNGHQRYTYAMGQMSIASIWNMTGELARERTMLAVGNSEHETDEIGGDLIVEDDDRSTSTAADPSSMNRNTNEMLLKSSDSVYLLNSSANLDLESSMRFLLDLYSHWFREGADAVPLPLLSVTVESVS
jgi:hypothetical protein